MIAEVVVLLPTFTPVDARQRPLYRYTIPDHLAGKLSPGHFVLVPFGRHAEAAARLVSGVVFRLVDHAPPGLDLKPVHDLLDPQPVVSETHLRLATWMADFYLAPLCECVRPFVPPGQAIHSDLEYALAGSPSEIASKSPLGSLQARIVSLLAQRGPLRAGQLSAALARKDWQSSLKSLIARGVVSARRVFPSPRTRPKLVRFVELAAACRPEHAVGLGRDEAIIQRRQRALDFLQREGRAVEAEWVCAESGCRPDDLVFLEKKGWVNFRFQEMLRDPLAAKDFVAVEPPALARDQQSAWDRIRAGLELAWLAPGGSAPVAFLLHGVTGSGKTEIYLRAVAETLAAGRQAAVLVPEISLTPQTIRRFAVRFAGRVAAWHSQLSLDEKYDTWRRIRAGEVDVVIGPRSALFSPLERLGLIVMDEEHEASYKQDIGGDLPFEMPSYHARELALELARLSGAAVILGSATPGLESYLRARRGEFILLELPRRILGHDQRLEDQQARYHVETRYRRLSDTPQARYLDLPPVHVVDMRQELRAGNRHIFSRDLQAALAEVLAAHQQAILFLNRRGSATFVMCRDCGHVMACPRCDLPLTYHESQAAGVEPLVCHRCNYQEAVPSHCPACAGVRIKYFGLGTQRVEKAVAEAFPSARVIRWDADTSSGRGVHEIFLQQFIEGASDVMIGTQMIAKGLDLPLVTLVGVISADTGLHLPDFRAAERTFQLLAQVAGRAGRGLLGGRVIVQTYTPGHYAVQRAAHHDYAGFAQRELAFRRQMGYPPFNRLARLLVQNANPRRAQAEAEDLARALLPHLEMHSLGRGALVGPAPCFLKRIRDQYRWQLVLCAPDPVAILRHLSLPPAWRVDIDPIDLL
ncbi:MAG: primosomal protein N' [Thermoflexales bacterium]|nr:primosomal protein N' [Thermoflexales bacterium]